MTRRPATLLVALAAASACAALVCCATVARRAFRSSDTLTGWLLMGAVLLLAAYGLRKGVPFVRWGPSRAWLRLHVALGLVAMFLFGMHLQWRVPGGMFECLLGLVFVLLTLSGIVGLVISRRFPRRLTALGEEVIFERIPGLRRRLRRESEAIVRESVRTTQSVAIADFYERQLQPIFERPTSAWRHLRNDHRRWHRLHVDMDEFEAQLSGAGRRALQGLRTRLGLAYQLDGHRALQGTLKLWLFVHVPLTWGLLGLGLVHVVVVHAFGAA